MFKISHNLDYDQNKTFLTPSYNLEKKIYLPKSKYNLTKTSRQQLRIIYRELLRILNVIRKIITDANRDIDRNIQEQLRLLEGEYPITREQYANYCSTIVNLIYQDTFKFEDQNIQQIYNNLKNKIIFTNFAQNIIRNVARFINNRRDRYNYLISVLDNDHTPLIVSTNYILENYLDIIDNNIEIIKNEHNNL